MSHIDAPTYTAASEVPGAKCSSQGIVGIVQDEPEWRARPCGLDAGASQPRAIPTRWRALEAPSREFGAETAADCHVVKIVLRNMNIRLSVAGRTVHDGVTTPGAFHVTEPTVPVRCVFRGPYDTLHLHIPNSMIDECAHDMPRRSAAGLGGTAPLARDPIVERLGRALVGADHVGGALGQLYADSISVAILARLLAAARSAAAPERMKVAELARWRLKRVIEYVEARLAEPVSLADVASAAGLTRMHFAAQFRAATGLRPHEYLLRRRVERAQEMLATTKMSVVEVGLSVGFQTQSHFTTVFKGFAGQPPHAWRQAQGLAQSALS